MSLCTYFGDSISKCITQCDVCKSIHQVKRDIDDLQKGAFAASVNKSRGAGSAIYFSKTDKEDDYDDWYDGGRNGARR